MVLGAGKTLGFYTCKTAYNAEITKKDSPEAFFKGKGKPIKNRTLVSSHNIPLILGYIPVIGIFIGIVRIAYAKDKQYFNQDITKGAQALCSTRGVCEILGLGILFLIPDLIASVVNVCRKKAS